MAFDELVDTFICLILYQCRFCKKKNWSIHSSESASLYHYRVCDEFMDTFICFHCIIQGLWWVGRHIICLILYHRRVCNKLIDTCTFIWIGLTLYHLRVCKELVDTFISLILYHERLCDEFVDTFISLILYLWQVGWYIYLFDIVSQGLWRIGCCINLFNIVSLHGI